MTGASVIGVPNEIGRRIGETDLRDFIDKHVTTWWAQNYDQQALVAPFIRIPLGIDWHTLTSSRHFWGPMASPCAQQYELQRVQQRAAPFQMRSRVVFISSSMADTHRNNRDRQGAMQALRGANTSFVYWQHGNLPRSQLWNEMAKAKFVVSPLGMGADCHRTWEALALGCIPIVKKSGISPLFKDMPVMVVDDWSEVTEANVSAWEKRFTFGAGPEHWLLDTWARRLRATAFTARVSTARRKAR